MSPAWDGSPSHSDLVDFLGRDPNWRDHAACRDRAVSDFWPVDGEPGKQQARECKAICATCSVRAECLADQMAQPSDHGGVWGGTTLTERRKLRRGQQIDFSARNAEIVELLRQGFSKSEVGLRFGLSQDQVRRIERRTA